MTNEEMRGLRPGDIIRPKHGTEALVVTGNYGDHVTAVRTYDVTNAVEWDLIEKGADPS